jgi:hypothetical protein
MLGHHPLLSRRLRKEGRRAVATVVEAKRTQYTETVGNDAIVGNTSILWKVVVSVEPPGEPPFQAELDVLLGQLSSTSPGDHFSVLYDPNDHSKVIVDQSAEGEQAAAQEAIDERVADRVERYRAAGQNDLADRYAAIHDPKLGLFGPLPDNPAERQKVMAERREKIREMMGAPAAGAGPAIVFGGQPMPATPPTPVSAAAATADALTKLADLRDRGVLTDAEFQAQKQRLLGGG